jgi:hypothetical protein
MEKKKVTINLAPLYPAQLNIVKDIIQSKSFYNIVNGSRQCGKSILLINLAMYFAMKSPKEKILIISPYDSQVKKLYTDIISSFGEAGKVIVKNKRGSGGSAQIILNNGAMILFRGAKSGDAIRGLDPAYILADEAAYIDEKVWQTAIEPSLTTKGKKVIMVSTPRGNNFFKHLWLKGQDNDDFYKSFKINYKDNPYAKLKFIEKQREQLATEIFMQEYEGVFMDQTSIFKDVRKFSTAVIKTPPSQVTIGIDVAFKNDFFVCTALDNTGQMVDMLRFNKVDTQEAVNRATAFCKKWNARQVLIEENNVGGPVIDLMRAAGVNAIMPFTTTSKSKGELIAKLMVDFNTGKLKILNDEIVIGEMEAFTYALTKSGNVTYAAAYGHDDVVMSLALANWAKGTSTYTPLMIM